jgi:hypothetical protein
MSGRGCTITVQLDNPRRDLKLSVGLHTPLHVLKTQLARVTNIRESNQVLILLDLSDPMRNSDVMLEAEEVDRYSLREIGICEGSTLSLHFIRAPAGAASASMSVGEDGSPRRRARGIGAASGGRSSRDAAEDGDEIAWLPEPESPQRWWRTSSANVPSAEDRWREEREALLARLATTHMVSTVEPPQNADHSYNAVMFNITNTSACTVEITAIHIAGMLGLVRVFACEGPWNSGTDRATVRPGMYQRSDYGVRPEDWELLTEELCQPSWDVPRPVVLAVPIVLTPYETRGAYVHSALPDDLGIQYTGHQRRRQMRLDTPVAQDEHILVTPGLGHTSSNPFDTDRGWYRAYRAPCGAFTYTATLAPWTLREHCPFFNRGPGMNAGLRALLLAHARGGEGNCLAMLPLSVVGYALEFIHFAWFEVRSLPARLPTLPALPLSRHCSACAGRGRSLYLFLRRAHPRARARTLLSYVARSRTIGARPQSRAPPPRRSVVRRKSGKSASWSSASALCSASSSSRTFGSRASTRRT